jgi:hypothetical protein
MPGTSKFHEPELLKLRSAGEMVFLKVSTCSPMKIGQYPEVSITGQAVVRGALIDKWFEVRIPEKSAIRQFERMKMDWADAKGCVLKISRDPNQTTPERPFWGITLAAEGEPIPTPTIPVVPPRASQTAKSGTVSQSHHTSDEAQAAYYGSPPPPDDRDAPEGVPAPAPSGNAEAKLLSLFRLHARCFAHANGLADEMQAEREDLSFGADARAAMSATCFIEANKRGIVL